MTDRPADQIGDHPGLLGAVYGMMVANAQRRVERVSRAWTLWRPYERRLVREAAVMGYVLGHQAGRIEGVRDTQAFPSDTSIVRAVIEHCDSIDDLYPYIADACAGRRRRVTRKRAYPGEFPERTP